jgi:hypothetical protein
VSAATITIIAVNNRARNLATLFSSFAPQNSWKINVQRLAVLQVDWFFFLCPAVDPGF